MTSKAYRAGYDAIRWNIRPKSPEPRQPQRDLRYDGPTPHFWNDVPHYVSPLSGREITSRSERREEIKRHGVREVEPSEGPHKDGSRYTNAKFMAKHGITPTEE